MAPLSLTCLVILMSLYGTLCERMCLENCMCDDHSSGKLGAHLLIDCSKKQLTGVPKDLSKFQNEKRPIHLVLSDNMINRVSKADFPENVPISNLELQSNRGVIITDDAFVNLKGLVSLNLDDVSLPFTGTMNYLKGLSKLRHLSLNKNYQFGAGLIPAALFSGVQLHLMDLQFHDCYLKGVEEGAFSSVMIHGNLDLGANQLDHIPSEVKTLTNLTSLDVSQNSIKTIPSKTFQGMSKLRKLSLTNNYINEMSFEIDSFSGVNLRELLLEQSVLNVIPSQAIASLSSLKVLKLKNSPIKSIPMHSFNGSYCLEVLDLTNILAEIGEINLDGLESCLKKLFLSNMQIREVPKMLKKFKVLDFVGLSGNGINVIKTDDFVGTTIGEVSLEDNPLTKVEKGAFEPFPHSISLSLSNTRLSNLSFVRDYAYGTVRVIELGSTTPSCDCELAFAEYRVFEIRGNCKINDTIVSISTEDFLTSTSHCWPAGRTPYKEDVWATTSDNNNGVERFSSCILFVLLPLFISRFV